MAVPSPPEPIRAGKHRRPICHAGPEADGKNGASSFLAPRNERCRISRINTIPAVGRVEGAIRAVVTALELHLQDSHAVEQSHRKKMIVAGRFLAWSARSVTTRVERRSLPGFLPPGGGDRQLRLRLGMRLKQLALSLTPGFRRREEEDNTPALHRQLA